MPPPTAAPGGVPMPRLANTEPVMAPHCCRERLGTVKLAGVESVESSLMYSNVSNALNASLGVQRTLA